MNVYDLKMWVWWEHKECKQDCGVEAFRIISHGKQERKIENNIRLGWLWWREVDRSNEGSAQFHTLVFAAGCKTPDLSKW